MESTTRTRELGIALRGIREEADLTGDELAKMLGWSPSKVSRLEHGKRGPAEIDIALYVACCGVLREKLDEVLAIARDTDDGYWLRPHSQRLPDELHSLTVQEGIASGIFEFEPLVVPGLLQTKDYARAVFELVGLIPEEGIALRVHARMRRQPLLHRYNAPQFTWFIHEHALRTPVGGPVVMYEQVLHLLRVSEQPHVQVRVVPSAAGPYSVIGNGFRVVSYADHPSSAYAECQGAGIFFDRSADVTMYRQLLARLAVPAMDGEQSRQWLAHLASEYDRME
ncbi:helix-turn-helix domain-containing protein [Amycolatopsis nigrescens]|uniref:helix-turn-helix domain-containing protein n=1 Tax=Amycolatopsis nigrescens TaxID=381445 RepID=UPI000377D72C|nr:helix-turn-helix transcriptional regulator [Amycolatopsis nigrescens]